MGLDLHDLLSGIGQQLYRDQRSESLCIGVRVIWRDGWLISSSNEKETAWAMQNKNKKCWHSSCSVNFHVMWMLLSKTYYWNWHCVCVEAGVISSLLIISPPEVKKLLWVSQNLTNDELFELQQQVGGNSLRQSSLQVCDRLPLLTLYLSRKGIHIRYKDRNLPPTPAAADICLNCLGNLCTWWMIVM